MKLFQLLTITRQFVIMVMLVTFLWWDSKPVAGPDGKIVCEFTDFPVRFDHHFSVGQVISIHEIRQEDQKGENVTYIHRVLNAATIDNVLWRATDRRVQKVANYFPWLYQILPSRFRFEGVWVLKLSLSSEQWEVFHAAQRRGNPLDYELNPD